MQVGIYLIGATWLRTLEKFMAEHDAFAADTIRLCLTPRDKLLSL